MTGRSDYGSRAWVYPALLSYISREDAAALRRGSQSDVLAGLRRLLARPACERRDRTVPAGTRAGWAGREEA